MATATTTIKNEKSAAAAAPPPPPAPVRHGRTPADPLSEKATTLLIRRTLCPNSSSTNNTDPHHHALIEDVLPPLTSRNDVDLQLYALLAIVVREFILTWYAPLAPADAQEEGQFVTAVVQIVAHMTRALEQRLRRVDLLRLLFDELPTLVEMHVTGWRGGGAAAAIYPGRKERVEAATVAADSDQRAKREQKGEREKRRAVYHAMWPLPALSPVPLPTDENNDWSPLAVCPESPHEAAYRQLLVGGLLAVLLPTEDLANGCLTSLVNQILAELILGGVLMRRVAAPWMMWEMMGITARVVREKLATKDAIEGAETKAKQKRTKPVIVVQPNEVDEPSSSNNNNNNNNNNWLADRAASWAWTVLRIGFGLVATIRFLVTSISLARSLPSRVPGNNKTDTEDRTNTKEHDGQRIPVLAYRLWPALTSLTQLDVRMPWLYGTLCMLQWLALTGPGQLGAFDGPLDRLLAHYLQQHALDPALLPVILRATRSAVFPGNKFGAPSSLVAPADEVGLAALRRRVAADIASVATTNPSSATLEEIGGVLDVLNDAYCNKHLLYGALETILVRLVPELADKDVMALWEERLN